MKNNNRTWLAFANRKRCRLADAIHTLGFISWSMGRARFAIGDVVYLFMSDLFGDEPSDLEGILTLLGDMGTSSRDLEDLFCVISLYRCSPNKSLIQKLAESMVERFCQPTATELEKLLAALLCYAGHYQNEDRELVIRCLKETDKVSDPLLRRIRNNLIRANLLQEEIPLSAEKEMDTLGVDWLDHFIGYHFFHYA